MSTAVFRKTVATDGDEVGLEVFRYWTDILRTSCQKILTILCVSGWVGGGRGVLGEDAGEGERKVLRQLQYGSPWS